MAPNEMEGLYPYKPNTVLPIVFAVIVGLSLAGHVYQNFRYKYWRVTFFIFWAGTVYTTGWIVRAISARTTTNLGLYIAETVLIYAGPPIYAAAEYNILGRLMHYLPMHTPLHPHRVVIFFIYLGAAVEALTAAGAARIAAASNIGTSAYQSGGIMISVALVLQAVVECVFMGMVGLLHHRCVRSRMLAPNVRAMCFMLYGTSTLVLLRCIFRAVESFSMYRNDCGQYYCGGLATNEWYIYVFEAAPMVVYTYWLNFMHPGKYLPAKRNWYLDPDGKTERVGPGWIDGRSKWKTFVDPFDMNSVIHGRPEHAKFWLRPQEWPACEDRAKRDGQ